MDNVNHLLKIATHFDLEVYTTSRKDKHLQALLKILRDIVEKQSDFTVRQIFFFLPISLVRLSLIFVMEMYLLSNNIVLNIRIRLHNNTIFSTVYQCFAMRCAIRRV